MEEERDVNQSGPVLAAHAPQATDVRRLGEVREDTLSSDRNADSDTEVENGFVLVVSPPTPEAAEKSPSEIVWEKYCRDPLPHAQADGSTDRYGFILMGASGSEDDEPDKKTGSNETSLQSRSLPVLRPLSLRTQRQHKLRESRRMSKWLAMARIQDPASSSGSFGSQHAYFAPNQAKILSRTFKGIPDRWRAAAWHSFVTEGKGRRSPESRELVTRYRELCAHPVPDDVQIDLDVPRTVSGHILFQQRYGEGQRALFRILHSVSQVYAATSGYVQGMASVASTLLLYYTEDEAFVMMCQLWQERSLNRLYSDNFAHLFELFKDLEQGMNATRHGKHLMELGIEPATFATRWFLTLFHYSLPFHTQLRVWDVFMLLGGGASDSQRTSRVLLAVALGLLHALRQSILRASFDECMSLLTRPIPVENDDVLMSLIYKQWRSAQR